MFPARRIVGGGGEDTIELCGDFGNVLGGSGNDDITVKGNFNNVTGAEGDDIIRAEGDNNILRGESLMSPECVPRHCVETHKICPWTRYLTSNIKVETTWMNSLWMARVTLSVVEVSAVAIACVSRSPCAASNSLSNDSLSLPAGVNKVVLKSGNNTVNTRFNPVGPTTVVLAFANYGPGSTDYVTVENFRINDKISLAEICCADGVSGSLGIVTVVGSNDNKLAVDFGSGPQDIAYLDKADAEVLSDVLSQDEISECLGGEAMPDCTKDEYPISANCGGDPHFLLWRRDKRISLYVPVYA
eukprot:scaffold34682_cov243-Amphora_coffeaeformis.AAC.5